MKKYFLLMTLFIALIGLTGCNHDDDAPAAVPTPTPAGTLFVAGQNFPLGANTASNGYNTLLVTAFDTGGSYTFSIYQPSSANSIALHVINENSNNVVGTYHFFDDDFGMDIHADLDLVIAGQLYQTTHEGTVTVIHQTNGNYKLVFDNVIVHSVSDPSSTKTITGYADLTFLVSGL